MNEKIDIIDEYERQFKKGIIEATKKTNALDSLSDLEVFVLLVSCLCHDIDHRGTNNSFQISSVSCFCSAFVTFLPIHEQFYKLW